MQWKGKLGFYSGQKSIKYIQDNIFASNCLQWYTFFGNSTTGLETTTQKAIEGNFGMENDYTSAYMLVYVRDSAMKKVLQEVTKEDIPPEVSVATTFFEMLIAS